MDTDADVREIIRTILEDDGYAVIEAWDGQEALVLLHTRAEPVVVLLDILLPRLSGIAVLEHVTADEHLLRHAYVALSATHIRPAAHLG